MSATRALLSTSRLMVVPRRGKALANWARPSIDEMGVPTESWKQVIQLYRHNILNSHSFIMMNKQTKHWTMIYVITLLTPDVLILPLSLMNT